MIIAVDGPAASGKGTISKRLAVHFDLPHMDTGLLYRAVAAPLLRDGQPLEDPATAADSARRIRIDDLEPEALRSAEICAGASVVAAIPEVRQVLFGLQRAFVQRPGGAVVDGRDIGTVICPEAEAKLFVTAVPETRAERRYKELVGRGHTVRFDDVLRDIKSRDERDQSRSVSPLKQADDALLLDTTELGIDAAFSAALALVQRALDTSADKIP